MWRRTLKRFAVCLKGAISPAYFFGRVKAEGLTESRYGSGRNHFSATTDQSQYPLRHRQAHLGSRCVRACAEVQRTFALTFAGRSFNRWLQQASTSCSSIRNASVAARAYRLALAMGRSKRACSKEPSSCRTRSNPTVRHYDMPYCGMGCGIKAETRNGRITRIIPWKEERQNTIIAASKAGSPLTITIILIACARLSYVSRVRATLHWLFIVEAGNAASRLSRLVTCYLRPTGQRRPA
jgi:hypothetical protein